MLKYFDHSTNRQRFFFVCANKDYFDSNPFGPLPTGHLTSDAAIPPMSRALQDPDSIPIGCHRYTEVEALAPPITPTRGFLTRVSKITASRFKGSPLFPNFENNTDGLSSTLLSTAYVSGSDRSYALHPPADLPAAYKKALSNQLSRGSFGVNTGLYSRTLSSGVKVLTSLTTVEQCNLGNFPADTCAVAAQLGLSHDEISCGVNGAVPPTVSFTLSSWLMSIMKAHNVPVVLQQKSSRPYHCGVSSVQELLTSDGFSKKWGGYGELLDEVTVDDVALMVVSDGEIDTGEHLAGGSMRCSMLAQGAAFGISPLSILDSYQVDAEICQTTLPSEASSLVRMHLDVFDCGVDPVLGTALATEAHSVNLEDHQVLVEHSLDYVLAPHAGSSLTLSKKSMRSCVSRAFHCVLRKKLSPWWSGTLLPLLIPFFEAEARSIASAVLLDLEDPLQYNQADDLFSVTSVTDCLDYMFVRDDYFDALKASK